jgi:hypothetical protein
LNTVVYRHYIYEEGAVKLPTNIIMYHLDGKNFTFLVIISTADSTPVYSFPDIQEYLACPHATYSYEGGFSQHFANFYSGHVC